MDSNICKIYIFGLLCLFLLTVESRPLKTRFKAAIANSLRNKIGFLETSLVSRIKLLQLEREYRLMKKYYDSGLSLEEARKRVKTVEDVISDILNRNKIDNEKNPDTAQKSMIIATWAQAFCALARQMGRQDLISIHCN